MGEAHDDFRERREALRERLEVARMRVLVNETGVRVLELAVLFSAFEAVARGAETEAAGGVPREELLGFPDPAELLAGGDDMTAGGAFRILQEFLGMDAEGEDRLWRILRLADDPA